MLEPRGMITLLIPDETLGKRVARFRKERLLTQTKLAAITGLYCTYIGDVEKGRKIPRIDRIARLAAGLRVTIGELVNDRSQAP